MNEKNNNNTGLYPPIVNTYMPVFSDEKAKIYYSLSPYTAINDIKAIQYNIVKQNTNYSALPNKSGGVGEVAIRDKNSLQNTRKGFFEIEGSVLENKEFELDTYYQVQIRFSKKIYDSADPNSNRFAYLQENQDSFSEWSTVCLIKRIKQPTIEIEGLRPNNETNTQIQNIANFSELRGKVRFDPNSEEVLKSYNFKFYEKETGKLIFESGKILAIGYNDNSLRYILKQELESNIFYRMIVSIATENEYILEQEYLISVNDAAKINPDMKVYAIPDNNNGVVQIKIESQSLDVAGNYIMKRASDRSGFKEWEEIKYFYISSKEVGHVSETFIDKTAESGILYKYAIQKVNLNGARGGITIIDNPIMLYLNDAFLVGKDFTLKLKYNCNISSMKYNYVDSKVDTIGSKYPFIQRNSGGGYRHFPISGLIVSLMNEKIDEPYDLTNIENTHMFSENNYKIYEKEFFGDNLEIYDKIKNELNISSDKDYIYERRFREKVVSFLQSGEIMLFKSLQEGNILVRLMDVNLTPNKTLGRLLYDFSANAFEIDEYSLMNIDKYEIQPIGNITKDTSEDIRFMGSVHIKDKIGLKEMIRKDFMKRIVTDKEDTFNYTIKSLEWIRIRYQSEPYVIIKSKDGLKKKDLNISNSLERTLSTLGDELYGYIAMIGEKTLYVSPKGFLEIENSNSLDERESLNEKEITFCEGDEIIVDYIAHMNKDFRKDNIAKTIIFENKAGQIFGTFEKFSKNLEQTLNEKFFIKNDIFYQKLLDIYNIYIEGNPGTIIKVPKEKDQEGKEDEFIIGFTGVLDFRDKDDDRIRKMRIAGLRQKNLYGEKYIKGKEENQFAPSWYDCIEEGMFYYNHNEKFYESIEKIPSPKHKVAYKIKLKGKTLGEAEKEWINYVYDNCLAPYISPRIKEEAILGSLKSLRMDILKSIVVGEKGDYFGTLIYHYGKGWFPICLSGEIKNKDDSINYYSIGDIIYPTPILINYIVKTEKGFF